MSEAGGNWMDHLPTAPHEWSLEQQAEVNAWAAMQAALWEVSVSSDSGKPRRLLTVRCGVNDCGAQVATVVASIHGPLFRSRLRPEPGDRTLAPTERLARRLGPQLDAGPGLEDLLHDRLGAELYEIYNRGEDTEEPLAEQICEDLLTYPTGGPEWHPPLLVRCKRHPEVKELDRDEIVALVASPDQDGRRTLKV